MDGEEHMFGWPQREPPHLKRTHAQMAAHHADLGQPSWTRRDFFSPSPSVTSTPHSRSERLPSVNLTLPPPSRPRFTGDGLDHRRPVMSVPPANNSIVIDLTSDEDLTTSESNTQTPPARPPGLWHRFVPAARPPRFGRDIIDLSEDTPPHFQQTDNAAPPAPAAADNSPDVQFVSSRPIIRPRASPRPTPPLRRSATIRPTGADIIGPADMDFDLEMELESLLYSSNDDEVEITGERTAVNPPWRARPSSLRPHNRRLDNLIRNITNANVNLAGHQRHHNRTRAAPSTQTARLGDYAHEVAVVRQHADNMMANMRMLQNMVPLGLNYNAIGFDLGLADADTDRQPTSPPTYQAPGPAPAGFTRSPCEEDVLVCPNCADELCVGENERKRQVWLVKACGHIYCGECTANRTKASRKGKAPVQPGTFKTCVVEGCTGKCSAKGMIQLFL